MIHGYWTLIRLQRSVLGAIFHGCLFVLQNLFFLGTLFPTNLYIYFLSTTTKENYRLDDEAFLLSRNLRTMGGLILQHCGLYLNKKFFTQRHKNRFRLPREVMRSPSLEVFQSRLDETLDNSV